MTTLHIVGGWTRPQLLIRLLQVIDAPWQPGPKGLHERGSTAVCVARMGGADPGMVARIRAGEDPRAPSILESDWPEIDGHHAVLQVQSTAGDPRKAAAEVLRCGASLVNAGGVAVVCAPSGVAHAGTRWLELATALDPADPLPALVQAWARWPVRDGDGFRTLGLAALGLRDLSAPGLADETLAHALCEDVVARQVAGAEPTGTVRALGRAFAVAVDGAGLVATAR